MVLLSPNIPIHGDFNIFSIFKVSPTLRELSLLRGGTVKAPRLLLQRPNKTPDPDQYALEITCTENLMAMPGMEHEILFMFR
jgi:hypothetical protein